MKTIWDGQEFRQVPAKEAEELVKADKAQILSAQVDGLSLKYRHQFSGYKTREVRAAPPPAPAPEPEQPKQAKPKAKAKAKAKKVAKKKSKK